ncbi:ankyrin repeat and fibronectin type-III domain-containing protein 1-like isoform X2 [Malaya genurostris]|uniref:ankyrin repeat and fibronectin type-III domain-containing protein 1-like isoform X2 n=1 Tax=Malaya genurostris TaxID=325434 RepID=UPI0026F3D657|nr:ankyrin repeat and fibronectin type-III domain-containing protein 1-like isoform X2 [Malaya genurostris]
MDDIPPLPPRKSSLSIDRAAFLLLRVKKAFKKKRQQRKDKLTLHNIHEPVGGARPLYGSRPIEKRAKLSRSLTLPIFNFGGTSAFVDRLQQQTQPLESFKTSSNNFLYESKITNVSTPISGNSPKILLTTTDDTSFDYRRKSSGGSGLFTPLPPSVAPADPHIYDFDEKRSSADGSVVISITSPTAYQIPMSKSFGLTSFNFVNLQNAANSATTAYSTGNNYVGSGRNNNFIGSGNVAPSDLGGSSMKRSSDTTAYGSAVSAQLINSSTNNAIYRLARIINQTTKATGPCGFTLPAPGLDTTHHQQVNDDSARRLSWERRDKDCKPIPRSSSIDSMVDVVWNEFPSSGSSSARNSMSNQSSNLLSNVPSNLNLFLSSNRRESVLSPSSNRRSKHQRGISALFAAVEHGHLEKARTILESTDVDVNSLKSDGLSPLDVAVLSNNRSMTKMLLQQGAIENAHTIQAANNNVGLHLNNLLCEAESTIHELGNFESGQPGQGSGGIGGTSGKTTFSNIIGSGGPSVTSCTGSDVDKQVGLWERRVKGLRRMILGWDQTKPPDLPHRIEIDVTGCTSISLRLYEPLEGAISTKFKVQWSSRSDFSNIVGEREVNEWTSFHGCMGAMCNLSELIQGRRYFFRACAGNIKGWGPFKQSTPNCVVPSSWRDVGSRENRFAGKQRNLDDLFNAVRLARPEDASEIALDAAIPVKRAIKKKTTIKQLFSAASKFQKNLKRGIYLACVLYHEDKLLLTNEDFVPVIEIDETFTSNLHTDFYWLMKVACTWDDVKLLRLDMERNASSAIHFRTKLLSAACQMQSALSITDLGQLYYKPLRDVHGTVVLSCVNCIKSPKSVSVLNSRWIPLNKIHKKLAISNEDSSINELLMNSIQEQINYHQVSNIRLPRGLYVGYLKMQSSVEVIQVVVPIKAPNVLPHCKIRDNPHVSAEEWELIRQHKHSNILEFRPKSQGPTEVQLHFLEILTKAMHNLFQYMDIPVDVAVVHRLYDIEVIELNHDVSFLIVCPPAESSCAVPGQKDVLLQRGDLFSMPIQAFEMIHLKTYQPSIVQKYSRLSCILELDTMMANHLHREAFSSSELQKAKDRLSKLQDLSTGLNTIWKGVRWLMDVISYARDRANMPELNMKQILDYKSTYFGKKISADKKVGSEAKLLQPPGCPPTFHKSSPGRGSWPGPAVENSLGHNGLLDAEHSKSEQLLKYNSQRFLDASSVNSRKNSADSAYSNSANSYYSVTGVEPEKDFVVPRLPPSRSEDTLIVDKKKVAEQTSSSKKRPPTMYSSYSATSSPLLNVRTPFVATIASVTKTTTGEDVENRVSNAPSLKVITKKPREQTLKTLNQIEPDYEPIVTTYLKPTLTALQNEAKGYQGAALHITEESPKHLQQLPPDVLNHRAITEPTIPDLAQSSQRRPIQPAPVVLQPKPVEASNSSETKPPTESTVAGSSASNSTAATTTPLITSIVQVYAAYETGLPSGTSLKLRVTQKTTAREVIDLVVKQLNMAVVLKGKEGPIYAAEKLDNFCLVAVIGARERCLRDDFRPLQLQNPWKKGRLYVRQKHDLLAAIEHSNRDTAEI